MSCRDRCHFLDGIAVRGDAQGLGLTMEGEVISMAVVEATPGALLPSASRTSGPPRVAPRAKL
jgi:hypothetical protein